MNAFPSRHVRHHIELCCLNLIIACCLVPCCSTWCNKSPSPVQINPCSAAALLLCFVACLRNPAQNSNCSTQLHQFMGVRVGFKEQQKPKDIFTYLYDSKSNLLAWGIMFYPTPWLGVSCSAAWTSSWLQAEHVKASQALCHWSVPLASPSTPVQGCCTQWKWLSLYARSHFPVWFSKGLLLEIKCLIDVFVCVSADVISSLEISKY